MSLHRLEFARQVGIANFIRVEVRDVYAHTVFYLECRQDRADTVASADTVPTILCHMLGKQDVPRIATVHHPFRDVDAGAGMFACSFKSVISLTGQRECPSAPSVRDVFSAPSNFHAQENRRLGIVPENQRAAVTGR